MKKIKATWDFLFEVYNRNLVKANHDVNKGGVVITVAEMCFKQNLGAKINFTNSYNIDLRDDEFLFSESVGRFVIETNPKDYDLIFNLAKQYKVGIKKIGTITSTPEITISMPESKLVTLDLIKMKNLYDSTIPNLMDV